MKVLAINPGGTSTKIAVYDEDTCIFKETVRHTSEELSQFESINAQYPFRLKLILEALDKADIRPGDLDAVAGRGGLLKPVPGGVYAVNDVMIDYVQTKAIHQHACNMGCLISREIADSAGIPSFVVDPVTVDEFDDAARITGLSDIEKPSMVHALNHKAVVKTICNNQGLDYEKTNWIVAHLGSGISIVPHKRGRMVDCTGGAIDGAFSNCRSGGLPVDALIKLCYSGQYTQEEMMEKVTYRGGMYSYLGTDDVEAIVKRYSGDLKVKLVLDAFVYQIVKEIGSYVPVLGGDVSGIILTGGMAYSKFITDMISTGVSYIAPVRIVGGEEELEALAAGAIRALHKQEAVLEYTD